MSFMEVEKKEGVAMVWLDQPGEKVNKLSLDLLDEFGAMLDDLEGDPDVQAAVLISRKPDTFIAGADIERFMQMAGTGQAEEMSRQGNALLSRMAESKKPVVAAIHGAALGGGLEVALACHYRIATDSPKTVLGQPEVQLGLLPAGGGTQRLPRLIGLQRALDLLLTGRNVYPYPARKMGLVDLIVAPATLAEAARKAALELARKPYRRADRRNWVERLLEGNPLGRAVIFRQAAKMVARRTRGNYPAPARILETVRVGLSKGLEAGLAKEAENFEKLMATPECRQLVNLFFAMNSAKKSPLREEARRVDRLAVLGGGLMGSGVADVSIQRGLEVYLKEIDQEALARAEKGIWDALERKTRKRILSPFQRDQIFSRLHGVVDYRGFSRLPLVIEAVFEDLELKQRILREVEEHLPETAVFASNTSSLPIASIAEASSRPETVLGMHYFSPVQKMPLLEIIVTDQTADWARATAVEVGIRQGKTVIVVGDGPGFYTTRILAPMMNEAMLVLGEGARVEELDRAMKRFGFPVGPAALMDEVGLDVGAHVAGVLAPMFEARGLESDPKAAELVEAGYKGRKGGSGFYRYDGKKKTVNEEIYRYFGGSGRRPVPEGEIQQRLALVMVGEAIRCLEEDILHCPRDGDLGAILGLGFPPFLGGPFRWADTLGASELLGRMEKLRERFGERFRPPQLLEEKAARGLLFHP